MISCSCQNTKQFISLLKKTYAHKMKIFFLQTKQTELERKYSATKLMDLVFATYLARGHIVMDALYHFSTLTTHC